MNTIRMYFSLMIKQNPLNAAELSISNSRHKGLAVIDAMSIFNSLSCFIDSYYAPSVAGDISDCSISPPVRYRMNGKCFLLKRIFFSSPRCAFLNDLIF